MKFTIRFANRLALSFAGLLLSLLVSFMFTSCEPLDSKAKEWTEFLKEKAEAGDAAAQYSLGEMYWDGDGVPRDKAEAAKWYWMAAEQGYVEAQRMLGFMYGFGAGVPENHVEAAKWYLKAAERGHVDAQVRLSLMYRNGDGVAKDEEEAAKWTREVAERERIAEAKRTQTAIEHAGALIQRNFGKKYYKGRGPESDIEAAKWFQKAAEQGFAGAQWILGLMYVKGAGMPKSDEEAAKWFRKAAEQGFADAQFKLGRMYYQGEGVPKDDMEAVKWMRAVADQGYAGAQWLIGVMYVNNQGLNEIVPSPPSLDAWSLDFYIQAIQDALEDDIELTELARQVAEQGNAPAYDDGEGVSKNDMEAYAWFLLAKGRGIEEADKVIDLLEKRLSAEQQAEGQRRAAELNRTIPPLP